MMVVTVSMVNPQNPMKAAISTNEKTTQANTINDVNKFDNKNKVTNKTAPAASEIFLMSSVLMTLLVEKLM